MFSGFISRRLPRKTDAAAGLGALLFLSAVVSLLLAGCAAPERAADNSLPSPDPGSLVLTVEPGPKWTHRIMIFTKVSPSCAGWVETPDGEYVATLMVSGKAGKGDWFGSPEGGRPESLPVWYHASGVSAAKPEMPAQQSLPAPDAVSAASSNSGASAVISGNALQNGREYVARFEINHSYDYNDAWKKADSGVNGQPSLIYEACFIYGNPETLTLKPIGHGSVDGSTGILVPSLEGFTTAYDIANAITLEVH